MISVIETKFNQYYEIDLKYTMNDRFYGDFNKYFRRKVYGIRDPNFDCTKNFAVFRLSDNDRIWIRAWNLCKPVKLPFLKELEELQIATPKLVTLSFFNLPTRDLRLQGK